jgi:hypothetical protein
MEPVARTALSMPSTAAAQPLSELSSRSTLRSAWSLSAGSPSRKDTSSAGSDALTLESLQPAGLMQSSLSCSVGSELSVGASPHSRS